MKERSFPPAPQAFVKLYISGFYKWSKKKLDQKAYKIGVGTLKKCAL
jgi:hypothetical protein